MSPSNHQVRVDVHHVHYMYILVIIALAGEGRSLLNLASACVCTCTCCTCNHISVLPSLVNDCGHERNQYITIFQLIVIKVGVAMLLKPRPPPPPPPLLRLTPTLTLPVNHAHERRPQSLLASVNTEHPLMWRVACLRPLYSQWTLPLHFRDSPLISITSTPGKISHTKLNKTLLSPSMERHKGWWSL